MSAIGKKLPPTLSAYLLAEAQRFLCYPHRKYRTQGNLEFQRFIDDRLRRFVEWRKTFAPHTLTWDVFNEGFPGPDMLDELYCREVLRQVPDMVERTRQLRLVTLEGISGDSFVYIREAANCYIQGLAQAAVALCRSAMELEIRRLAGKRFGVATVAGLELKDVIERFGVKLLLPNHVKLAHRVRTVANKVLHEEPASLDKALEVLEAARSVILELGKRAG
jgi:hypothetical protein